jgi:hypothetical protein
MNPIDTKPDNLRQTQPAETDLGFATPAPDVENAVAGTRLECVLQELCERRVPPSIAEVLERRRRERVNFPGD